MNKISLIVIGLVLISLTGGGAMAAELTDEQKINYLHTLCDSELNYRMNLYQIAQYEAMGIPNLTEGQLYDYNLRLTVKDRDIKNIKKYIKTLKTGGVPNLKKADIILPRLVELGSLKTATQLEIDQLDADWAQYLIDHEQERIDIELWITQSNPPQEDIDARWAIWNENWDNSYNWYTNTRADRTLRIAILDDLMANVSQWNDLL